MAESNTTGATEAPPQSFLNSSPSPQSHPFQNSSGGEPAAHTKVSTMPPVGGYPALQPTAAGSPNAGAAFGEVTRGGPLPVPKRFVPYYDVLRKRRESWSNFPSGLRVLVADNEPASLQVVEKMLKKCNYQVTLCSSGKNSLEILRKRREEFDIVLAEASLPDIDGFKILDVCSKELSLPVVLMSASGETSSVMRGVMEGARDFLIKPLRHEELKTLWQHVVRYTNELTKPDSATTKAAKDPSAAGKTVSDNGQRGSKSTGDSDKDSDSSSSKKQRVIWSAEMHQQFVAAVNQLGIDKAVPKRILDLMNIKGLTRENVASHLQKYRLYLKRMANTQDGGVGGLAGMEGLISGDSYPVMVNNPNGAPQHGSQGALAQQQFHFMQQQPTSSAMPSGNSQVLSGMHMPSGTPGVMQPGQLTIGPQHMIQMSNGSHMLVTMSPQHMQQAGMMPQDMMQQQPAGMTMMNGMISYPMVQVQQQQGRGDGMAQVKSQPMQHQIGYVNQDGNMISIGEMHQQMHQSSSPEIMYGSGSQQRQPGNWQQLQGGSNISGWHQNEM